MQCNCLKYNYLIFRTPHKSVCLYFYIKGLKMKYMTN
jgi:hypothetical protein